MAETGQPIAAQVHQIYRGDGSWEGAHLPKVAEIIEDALAAARREERERCGSLTMPHLLSEHDPALEDAYANGWNDYRAAIRALGEE